jgi:hypothetical protein
MFRGKVPLVLDEYGYRFADEMTVSPRRLT